MKKVFLTTLISLAFASSAFAATPVINVDPGQVGLGYSNYNLSTEGDLLGDLGSFKADGYQVAYGLSDKLALIGDYMKSEKRSFNSYYGPYYDLNYNSTSLGLQYKVNDNLAVSAGTVKAGFDAIGVNNFNQAVQLSNSTDEIFGGISYQGGFTSNLDGYASYQKSAHVQDAKIGLKYGLGANTSLDVNYRDYQDTNSGIAAKGVGVGMNYRF